MALHDHSQSEPQPYYPGYEFGYDQITSSVNVTSTTESSGTIVISCAPHTFDGGLVMLEVFFPQVGEPSISFGTITVCLFESTTQIGRLGANYLSTNAQYYAVADYKYRFTPSAGSHTYTITAYVSSNTSSSIVAGAGGTGAFVPGFARFTKV